MNGSPRRLVELIIGVLLAASAILGSSAPALAAQPPPGYPTSQVMATVANPSLGSIPIRRGFYDADANTGFGMDKAWHKHRITSLNAQKKIMGSPNYTRQGNGNYALKAYAGYYLCGRLTCTLQKQQLVIGVYAPNSASFISGWPVGGKIGLLTAYCNNDDRGSLCPEWVIWSFDHPGQPNPYPATAQADSEMSNKPEKASPDSHASASPGTRALISYTELPTTIAP